MPKDGGTSPNAAGKSESKKSRSLTLEPDTLENSTWRSLADTYRTIHLNIMSDLRHYGLTPPQYSVLRTIGKSERGYLPMSEIGKQMIVTFANITTIVDNLEKRKLVRRIRNKEDRRIVYVELTKEGAKLFGEIYKAHRRQVAKLMQALTNDELESLRRFTTKIRSNIESRKA